MTLQRRDLRLVLLWAKRVDHLLLTGIGAAGLIIGGRIFASGDPISLFGVDDVPLNATWVLFGAFTLGHAAFTRFLLQYVRALPSADGTPGEKAGQLELYDDIVAEGGWLVGVAIKRLAGYGEHRSMVPMSSKDPSTWLSYGAVLIVWIAMLPWWWDDGLHVSGLAQLLATAVVAALLLVLNWVIGGMWAVAISSLGVGQAKLPYFLEFPMTGGSGGLNFGLLSGAVFVLVVLVSVVVFGHSHLGL